MAVGPAATIAPKLMMPRYICSMLFDAVAVAYDPDPVGTARFPEVLTDRADDGASEDDVELEEEVDEEDSVLDEELDDQVLEELDEEDHSVEDDQVEDEEDQEVVGSGVHWLDDDDHVEEVD